MKPLGQDVVRRLRFNDAVDAEATSPRGWMPAEPAWATLQQHATQVESTLAGQLRAGKINHPELVANMRKVGSGIRPLAVWHPFDRIVYRALTDFVLRNASQLDESGDAYTSFLNGPAAFAQESAGGTPAAWIPGRSQVGYIVKTDITAFYQFVDHNLLAEQLLLLSDDIEAIDALIELLGEVQGRRYGLPQMLQSSDRLADIYIQALERKLLRQGRRTWRYNDDFRLACTSYDDALLAIEQFAVAARSLGLVMSEHKTTTPSLLSYLTTDIGMSVSDGGDGEEQVEPGISPDEFLSDYSDVLSVDDNPEDALAILNRITTTPAPVPTPPAAIVGLADFFNDPPINLTKPSPDDIRRIRRALNKLARLANDQGAHHLPAVVAYLPILTPNVVRYLRAMPVEDDTVSAMVDVLVGSLSLNSWQQMWFLHLIQERAVSGNSATPSQRQWVTDIGSRSPDPLVKAQALLTAACLGLTNFDALETALISAPSATSQWYYAAINIADPQPSSQRTAVAESDRLARWILG